MVNKSLGGGKLTRVPKRRLGVALVVPPPFDREIDGMRRALGDGSLGRIPPHITLVPPVNVREDRFADALAVLRRAAGSVGGALSVEVGPPATFLPASPVLYLQVGGDGLHALAALRDAVFVEPLARNLTWPFVPHLTIADEADPERITAGLSALRDYRASLTFERVHLLAEGEGRQWAPVADAVFRPPAVIGRGGLEVEISESERLDPEAAAFAAEQWRRYSLGEYGDSQEEEPVALTARRRGEIVGTATGTIREHDSYLARLIVPEQERGAGVGSHLLAAFEALAVRKGRTRLTLHTLADGPAREFYERRGWVAILTMPRWRAGRDFVQMERVL